MKRFKISASLLSLVFALSLVSCDDNEAEQNYPPVGAKPLATLTADKTALTEADDDMTTDVENMATFTLTSDVEYKTDRKFKVEFMPNESTGSLDDIELSIGISDIENGSDGFLVTLPKFETSTSFTISAIFDIYPEATETFKFRVYPIADLNGAVAPGSQEFTFTVENSVSDELVMILDWNGDAEYLAQDGDYYTLSDFDFDLEMYFYGDVNHNSPLLTSYNDSPESFSFLGGYPDGTYTVTPSLWTVAGAEVPELPINFNVTLTVAKKGQFVRTFDLSGYWNSTTGGVDDGNPDGYYDYLYFTKSTDVDGNAYYEVYNYNDDSLIVEGRVSNGGSLIQSGRGLGFPAVNKRM